MNEEMAPRNSLGLSRIERPEAKHSFLRCQLGRYVVAHRSIGCQTVRVTLFHLLGYGSSWDEATDMVGQRKDFGGASRTSQSPPIISLPLDI